MEDVLELMDSGLALGETGVGRSVETDRGLITAMDCGLAVTGAVLVVAAAVAAAALRLLDIEMGLDMPLARPVIGPCLLDTEVGLLDTEPPLLDTDPGLDIEVGLFDMEPGLLELNTGATLVADLVMLVGRDLPFSGLLELVIAVSPLTLGKGSDIGGALLGLPSGNTVDTIGGELPPPTFCPSSLCACLVSLETLIGLLSAAFDGSDTAAAVVAAAAPNPTAPSPTAATPSPIAPAPAPAERVG